MLLNEIENKSNSDNTNIPLPTLKIGDEIRIGKWKNKRAIINGFEKDVDGQLYLKTNKGRKRLFNFVYKTGNDNEK